jgi:hypothetical protein
VLEWVKSHNPHLTRITKNAIEGLVALAHSRKLMVSILGLEDEEYTLDILGAFACYSDSQVSGWSKTEAIHAHRGRNLELRQDFMSAVRSHRVCWLSSINVDDCRTISSVMDDTSWLEDEWEAVNGKLEWLEGCIGRCVGVYE